MPRPKTPTAIAKARGNPGKRRLNESEPRFTTIVGANPPGWLGSQGRSEFRRLVEELRINGLLQAPDLACLAIYCQLWERYVAAAKTLKSNGVTYKTKSTTNGSTMIRRRPEVNVCLDLATKIRAFASEFGFTPASRARVHAPGNPAEDRDPIDEELFGTGA